MRNRLNFKTTVNSNLRAFAFVRIGNALLVAVALATLVSCTQDDAQLSLLVDSFNSQIEEKNKAVEQARASETQLKLELAETSGRMREMEVQLAEAKKAPPVTPEAVASAVLSQLKPALDNIALNAAKSPTPASASAPTTPPSPASSEPGITVSDEKGNGNREKFIINFP